MKLQWFSAGGFPGWTEDDGGGFWDGLQALLLPAVALAVVQASVLARWTRSAVLEVMREDFVGRRAPRDCRRRAALWRHVLRNAMIPVLTVMGLQFAYLITGTVVVEKVFVLPGVGRLVFQAIANRDLVVVRDVVMLLVAMVVAVNFVVDVLYAVVDPRLKARSERMTSCFASRARRTPELHARCRAVGAVRRRGAAVAGVDALAGRRDRHSQQAGRRAPHTGWAPTAWVATSRLNCWWARATRSWSAWWRCGIGLVVGVALGCAGLPRGAAGSRRR